MQFWALTRVARVLLDGDCLTMPALENLRDERAAVELAAAGQCGRHGRNETWRAWRYGVTGPNVRSTEPLQPAA